LRGWARSALLERTFPAGAGCAMDRAAAGERPSISVEHGEREHIGLRAQLAGHRHVERYEPRACEFSGGIEVNSNGAIASTAAKQDSATLENYGCGGMELFGPSGLYDRHLLFDNVIDRGSADARDRFEAFAHSVRDVLSQRWTATESTYDRLNPKRIYYLSMEFLIGRSLANNITNLFLDPEIQEAVRHHSIDWAGLLEEEPDAALGNGGLGRL